MNLYWELQKSFLKMEAYFKEEALLAFLACDYSELSAYHFGFGTWIRNDLLKETGPLFPLFVKIGLSQKDDLSALLIRLFYLHLRASKG